MTNTMLKGNMVNERRILRRQAGLPPQNQESQAQRDFARAATELPCPATNMGCLYDWYFTPCVNDTASSCEREHGLLLWHEKLTKAQTSLH